MAKIDPYPDKSTSPYAELWCVQPFRFAENKWGLGRAEHKGDEHGIDCEYKVDIPAMCWVVHEGTDTDGPILQLQPAAQLDNPPGAGFLPIRENVNVIAFGAGPDPQPAPPDETGLVAFRERAIDHYAQLQQPLNDALDYGVGITHVSGARWRCIGVHHLAGAENNGNHHIYLDAIATSGALATGIPVYRWVVGWADEGLTTAETPGFNLPLWRGDVVTIKIDGLCDAVTGLSTAHPDEEPGNTLYHHSFYVVYAQVPDEQPQPEPEPEPGPQPEPEPEPPTGGVVFRVLMVCEDGHVPALLKAGPGETIELSFMQRPPAWFDALADFITTEE